MTRNARLFWGATTMWGDMGEAFIWTALMTVNRGHRNASRSRLTRPRLSHATRPNPTTGNVIAFIAGAGDRTST